ncbi:MAG: hypothetical protein KDK71_04355 [Chlamydiia bacterium]|nr:hypothetical protein [Chlamydiia bacterium]
MVVEAIQTKVVDATLFFQDAQVEALHEKMFAQEIHLGGEVSKTIETVNQINVDTLSFEGRNTFQSLCGRLHQINTDRFVDQIVDTAQDLRKQENVDQEDLFSLKAAMTDVWENNSLSEENAGLLRFAATTVKELSSEKEGVVVNLSLNAPAEEEMPLPDSTVKGTELSANWEEAELSFDLLETATLLYQGKIGEGLALYETLPKELRLPKISENSNATEIATFIQEAVVKSFEISRKDGYIPSEREIQVLLDEAADLS